MIYQPREDSFLLEKTAIKYVKGKSVLDMGTGSGIIGYTAIRVGAESVTFADINAEAIRPLKKRGLKAVQTDLFSNIKTSFDVIVFNPPYLPEDDKEDKKSALATTGGKNGDEIACRFIQQAGKHLNPGGKILILLSSLTPRSRFDALCKKQKFSIKTVASQKLSFEELYVLLIEQNSFKP